MLREFSIRRIVFFSLFDWGGTVSVLLYASSLGSDLGDLAPLVAVLRFLRIPVGAVGRPGDLGNGLGWQVMALASVIWPFFFTVFYVYEGRRNETLQAELLNVFLAIFVSTMALGGVLYFSARDTPRVQILVFFLLDLILLLGGRITLAAFRHCQKGYGRGRRRGLVIVGAGKVGREIAEELEKYVQADTELVGYLDDDPAKEGQTYVGLPVLGTLGQSASIIAARDVRDAVVALPLDAHDRLIEVCRELQMLGARVYVIPDLFALSFPSATLDGFGGIPVIDLGIPGIHGVPRLLKRSFDVIAVSLGFILLSPLLLPIAILIKLDSPGPVLYKQLRIGEDGRCFTMWKFRSMRTDTDPGIHKAHVARLIQENLSLDLSKGNSSLKMENDPRITRIGKFIRKTSIDELPQIFNVLRGEMSLVGPRPPLPYEVELYKDWHKRRFEAIPGITGLWQVKGRNRVSFDEMVRMDIEYIEHQSFWLDLKILLQTPLAVIAGIGAG